MLLNGSLSYFLIIRKMKLDVDLLNSKNWLYSFLKQNQFSFRRPTKKEVCKFVLSDKEEIVLFLTKLKDIIADYDDNAIINMDETHVLYENLPKRTLAKRGIKNVLVKGGTNEKEGFTGVSAVTKSSKQLKQMAIFSKLKYQ